MKPYLKYIGSGFLPGIPARDLTKEEAEHYGIKELLDSGLYQLIEKKPEKKDKKDGE